MRRATHEARSDRQRSTCPKDLGILGPEGSIHEQPHRPPVSAIVSFGLHFPRTDGLSFAEAVKTNNSPFETRSTALRHRDPAPLVPPVPRQFLFGGRFLCSSSLLNE